MNVTGKVAGNMSSGVLADVLEVVLGNMSLGLLEQPLNPTKKFSGFLIFCMFKFR